MSKEKWKDVRNDKGNAVLDCSKRRWNGAMCAKTTKGNGVRRVRGWTILPECIASPQNDVPLWWGLWASLCYFPYRGVTKAWLIISDSFFLAEEGRHIITVHEPIHAGTVSFVVQKDFKDYKSLKALTSLWKAKIHKPVLTDFGTHRRYWTALSHTKCSFLFFFFL